MTCEAKAEKKNVSEVRIKYKYHRSFDARGAAKRFLGPMPTGEGKPKTRNRKPVPEELIEYAASIRNIPILTLAQERHLFLKMNYLKHRAAGLPASQFEKASELLAEANAILNQIVEANLRLAFWFVRNRHNENYDPFAGISEANWTLYLCAQTHDVERGKFSTHAVTALRRNRRRRPLIEGWRQRPEVGDNGWIKSLDYADATADPSVNHDISRREQLVRTLIRQLGKISPTGGELNARSERFRILEGYRGLRRANRGTMPEDEVNIIKERLRKRSSKLRKREAAHKRIKQQKQKRARRWQRIICQHFGFGKRGRISFTQLARLLGLSRERVGQLTESALERLQQMVMAVGEDGPMHPEEMIPAYRSRVQWIRVGRLWRLAPVTVSKSKAGRFNGRKS